MTKSDLTCATSVAFPSSLGPSTSEGCSTWSVWSGGDSRSRRRPGPSRPTTSKPPSSSLAEPARNACGGRRSWRPSYAATGLARTSCRQVIPWYPLCDINRFQSSIFLSRYLLEDYYVCYAEDIYKHLLPTKGHPVFSSCQLSDPLSIFMLTPLFTHKRTQTYIYKNNSRQSQFGTGSVFQI